MATMYTDKQKEDIWVKRTQREYPGIWRCYLDLVEAEVKSRDELAELNFRKRKKIVEEAFEHSKFYRKLYSENGISPRDIKTEADWDNLPIVTKDMIRAHMPDMVIPSAMQYATTYTTSGSTGFPLTVYVDKYHYMMPITEWYMHGIWQNRPLGCPVGDIPILGLNEARIDRLSGIGIPTQAQLEEAAKRTYPMRRFWLDALGLTIDKTRLFMKQVQEDGGGVHFRGHTGSMLGVAEMILSGKVDLTFKPVTLGVGAAVLTKSARADINRAFGVCVHDYYGCNEVGHIAAEGSDGDGSLYVLSQLRHIDLIDEKSMPIHDESTGRLLITSLNTRVMPLIKYKLGDRTHFILKEGVNKLPFQRLAKIEGRETDYLKCSDGTCVYGLSAAFDDYPNCVLSYRFIEHAPGRVTLMVVPNTSHVDYKKEIEQVQNEWKSHAQGKIDIAIKYVDYIENKGGKIRFIVHEDSD